MLVWLVVLQRLPVGIAYPMLSLNFVWVTLAAKVFWRENVALHHWLGVGLIIIGIIIPREPVKGAFWALCSVLLVSAAQLLLRDAMQALPPVSELLTFISALWHVSSGTGALLLGLMGYVASMGCWYWRCIAWRSAKRMPC